MFHRTKALAMGLIIASLLCASKNVNAQAPVPAKNVDFVVKAPTKLGVEVELADVSVVAAGTKFGADLKTIPTTMLDVQLTERTFAKDVATDDTFKFDAKVKLPAGTVLSPGTVVTVKEDLIDKLKSGVMIKVGTTWLEQGKALPDLNAATDAIKIIDAKSNPKALSAIEDRLSKLEKAQERTDAALAEIKRALAAKADKTP